jgi:hypothetical protein
MDFGTIINHVRENSPDPKKCMISFSGGKDAWVCWIALRECFETTCYAYYLVPGLSHVDEYLDRCEKKVGKIWRYPSPHLYGRLNDLLYQPPERVPVFDKIGGLPKFDFDAVSRICEISTGLPEKTWTAIGVRAADSIARASALKAHGPWSDNRRVFYPVHDWKKDRVISELRKNDIKLSSEYKVYGRTFDGLFLLYALGLKENYPKDYQKVLEYFPFVDLEIFRYEKGIPRYGSEKNLPKNVVMPEKKQTESRFNFSFPKKAPKPGKKDKYSILNNENKRVAEKMQNMVNPEFWVSVYFQDDSRFQIVFEDAHQRDFLLRHLKIISHGDKYIDGAFLARKLDVKGNFPERPRFDIGKSKTKSPICDLKYSGEPMADCYMELAGIVAAMPAPTALKNSQSEKFLNNSKWPHENGNVYCNALAEKLGVELPETVYYYRPRCKYDPKLSALVG